MSDVPMITPDPVDAHLVHLRLRNLAVLSVTQRRYALLRLASFLDCSPAELLAATGDDLHRWQVSQQHLSPRYRSSQTTHIRQFYRWAVDQELVRVDPGRALLTVNRPRAVPHPIGEADLRMAIACAPDRIRPWLVLAGYSGLRAAEIAGMSRENVRDTADPAALVVNGKGNRQRIVPLSDLVLMELRASGMPSRGFLFSRRDGAAGQNTPGMVSQLCNRYLHGLGITESLHSLRHRFGTQMYAVSTDLRMTQEVMGHGSPSTTSGYVQWSAAAAVAAVRSIAGERAPDGLRKVS